MAQFILAIRTETDGRTSPSPVTRVLRGPRAKISVPPSGLTTQRFLAFSRVMMIAPLLLSWVRRLQDLSKPHHSPANGISTLLIHLIQDKRGPRSTPRQPTRCSVAASGCRAEVIHAAICSISWDQQLIKKAVFLSAMPMVASTAQIHPARTRVRLPLRVK